MKYLTDDLYVIYFDTNRYIDNDDKFLIGYLNNSRTKLKDVITGQILPTGVNSLMPIKHINLGTNMALRIMTSYQEYNASFHQKFLADEIDAMVTGELLDEREIIKIKDIMNKEITKTYLREKKQARKEAEKQAEKSKYKLTIEDREF